MLWWVVIIIVFVWGVFLFLFLKINKILNLYLYPPRILNKKSPKDFGLEFEEFNVQINQAKIAAWFFEGKSEITLIFVPGFVTNRSIILEKVWPLLKKREVNAVIFDPRGQGDSEGKFLMGAFMDEDVSAIIDWLKKNKGLKKFALLGTSLGATVALVVASKRKDVIATVADSPFMNISKISSKEVFRTFPSLAKIFLPFARAVLFLKFKRDLFRKLDVFSVIENVSHVFFIHGKNDKVINYKHSLTLYKRAKEPKEIWITEADHCESFTLYPKEYFERVLEFIKSQNY